MWLQIGCGDGQIYLFIYVATSILDVKIGGVIMNEAWIIVNPHHGLKWK
jgi:hypothetical protein